MEIQLFINGQLKKWWSFESKHADTQGETGYLARKAELEQRLAELKAEPQVLLLTGFCERWEFYVRMKSKKRASDVLDTNLLK